MRIRRILAVVMVAIMLAGCGKVDEEITAKVPEKKEETIVETEVESIAEEVPGEEDEGTKEHLASEVVEESTVETVPTEQVKSEEVQKTEQKTEQKKTQTKAETPAVTTPVVSEPTTSVEPETKMEECTHLYEPVEWEEYTGIRKMVWGCNGCGFPLFTIDPETHDAVNIPDLYFHRECYSEKLGMMCPKPCGWHSEQYYMGYCYRCHGQIQMRCCDYFYKNTEYCVKNAGDLGGYEKVESDCAYIKSCSCGQNILMSGGEKGGLMLKREVCKYCGDVKTYP
ncbi:MAG: hypothetical protein IJZ53_06390 [Tyzzerella sp.]|nr:hypothetical protein [Tyzzerella sp.]